jgi:hypothetical protein
VGGSGRGSKTRPCSVERGAVVVARGGEKGGWLGHRPECGGGGRHIVREQGREKGRLADGPSSGVGPIHQ